MNIQFHLPLDASGQNAFTTPLRLLLATTAAFWMGTAQPHAVATTVPRQITELRLRDFYRSPAGSTGLDSSDTVRHADGESVRLLGYMVEQENATPGRFLFTPRPMPMRGHADAELDDLPHPIVVVNLSPGQQDWAVPHVPGLVAVSGRLSVNRFQERGGRVSQVHLQLDANAARSMNPSELTGYLHKSQFRH